MNKQQYYDRARAQLSFECHRCGRCCRLPPLVVLSGKDINRMATHLKLSRKVFIREYTRRVDEFRYLKTTTPCIFLEGNDCSIYEVRPMQCRGYPYLLDIKPDAGVFYMENCAGTEDAMVDQIALEHDEEYKTMQTIPDIVNTERKILDRMLREKFERYDK
jgi:Fe-S-cluster containining protein